MSNQATVSLRRRDLMTLVAAGAMTSWPAYAQDANAIVRQADTARGGGLPGVIWNIHLVSSGADDATDGEREMLVKANTTASVAETLSPVRFRGTKLLQVERNMWLSRPGLQKPVPISPRQKLSGQAANGDIAATNYGTDYDAKVLRQEPVDGDPCYALNLIAKNHSATYDQILYWVSVRRQLAVKAQFMAVSGKLLKSAIFEYNNKISVSGKTQPFVSRMTISDALTPAKTVMDYSNVQVQALPNNIFDVGNLL